MYTGYVIDTETTGLDYEKNEIIELCIWRIGDAESKTWCLKPLSPETIDEEALQVNNHKLEDILWKTKEGREKYRIPSEVVPEIEMWIMSDGSAAEERIFIGQNPDFDYQFMLNLWKRVNSEDTYPFGYWIEGRNGHRRNQKLIIDTIQLALLIDICTGKKRNRYGLGALVKSFSITKAQAHRADGDVKMTKDLFEKIIAVLKDPIIAAFNDCYSE